jgi:hypothetical protein
MLCLDDVFVSARVLLSAQSTDSRHWSHLNSKPSVNSSSCTPTCARLSTCTSSCITRTNSCGRRCYEGGGNAQQLDTLHTVASPQGQGASHLDELQAAGPNNGASNQIAVDDRLS